MVGKQFGLGICTQTQVVSAKLKSPEVVLLLKKSLCNFSVGRIGSYIAQTLCITLDFQRQVTTSIPLTDNSSAILFSDVHL